MNKPTTLATIQTIKEAKKKLIDLPNLALHNHFPNNMRGNEVDDVKEWANQTLLAVFESELEEIKIDVKTSGKYETYTDGILEGTKQENERLRSHLTEVINYLKQK